MHTQVYIIQNHEETKSNEKLMKSMRERRNVIESIRRVFFTILVLVGSSWGCKSQSKDTLYILFEKDKPHMMFMEMKDDDHYAFWVSESLYLGFRPIGAAASSKYQTIGKEMKDISWIRDLTKSKHTQIKRCPNIFIVEKIGNDSLKLTPVKAFEAIE